MWQFTETSHERSHGNHVTIACVKVDTWQLHVTIHVTNHMTIHVTIHVTTHVTIHVTFVRVPLHVLLPDALGLDTKDRDIAFRESRVDTYLLQLRSYTSFANRILPRSGTLWNPWGDLHNVKGACGCEAMGAAAAHCLARGNNLAPPGSTRKCQVLHIQ